MNLPKIKIDETDLALLNLLQKDGRITNVNLAKSLNLSETPCWRRQKRLEEAGCIQGYHGILDRRILGLGVTAFVNITFAIHTGDSPYQFEAAIQEIPEVMSCHNVTGEADYFLQIVAKDLESYERILSGKLRRLPGVTSIKSSFSLRKIKDTTQVPLGGMDPINGK